MGNAHPHFHGMIRRHQITKICRQIQGKWAAIAVKNIHDEEGGARGEILDAVKYLGKQIITQVCIMIF